MLDVSRLNVAGSAKLQQKAGSLGWASPQRVSECDLGRAEEKFFQCRVGAASLL